MRSFVSLGLFACFISLVSAAISCNSSNHCPEDSPCCSQYGTCGTGSYCLGGCDIRYSYNLSACMPMPRMSSIKDSFASIDDIENQSEYLGNSSEATWVYTGYIDSHDDALLLQMPNGSTGTVVSSTEYFLFGKVGATMKSSRDRGVITAFITFSDVQDEIDYEFVGYNLTNPQTNYYAKGILNYTNSRNSSVSNTFSDWHYYEIDWQEERIVWSIDGNEVRTLERDDTYNATTDRYDYPQTPARLQFSLWPGGSSLNGLGTIEWAGGAINWDSQDIQDFGYYYAYVKNVTVTPHDLPDSVQKSGNSSLNAFLYNSTAGNLENVYLTNKKTWLGSGDATGFDPENEDDDLLETTEIVSSSASSAVTKTSVKTKSASTTSVNVPGQDATNGGTTDEGTTASYTGGFVQNSKKTSSGSSSSGSSSPSSSSSGAYRSQVESIVAVFVALGAAMFTFGL